MMAEDAGEGERSVSQQVLFWKPALASVVAGITGEFFYEQTVDSLATVLASFEERRYEPQTIRNHALEFDTSRFHRRILQFIGAKMSERKPKELRTPTNELVL